MDCPQCAKSNPDGAKFCSFCGSAMPSAPPEGAPQPMPTAAPAVAAPDPVREFASRKVAAGVCGILLGAFGVHKFILGLNGAAVTMLVVTLVSFPLVVLTCGASIVVPWAMGIIGLIEGIMYLSMNDQDFYQTYAVRKKGWF